MVTAGTAPLDHLTGSCDSHVHVFEPDTFPFDPDRAYTPGKASVTQLRSLQRRLGVTRSVLVQPSVYGTDNAGVLSAAAQLGLDVCRVVAVIDPTVTSDEELAELSRCGVTGVRLNHNVTAGSADIDVVRALISTCDRVAPFGLSVQVHVPAAEVRSVAAAAATAPTAVVFDHYAGLRGVDGAEQPGWAALLDALTSGNVWVKLSAPYRVGVPGELDWMVDGLVTTRADRLVWGSDWPHTGGGAREVRSRLRPEPFRAVDDVADLTWLLGRLGPNQQMVISDNAESLYHFAIGRAAVAPARGPLNPSTTSSPESTLP